jgi:hypothetical protein
MEKKIKKRWSHVWRGEWRASRNGGWEWEFGGVWKMKAHIEVPLELVFCPKPPNFGVEAHIEVPTGVSLTRQCSCQSLGDHGMLRERQTKR